MLKERKSDHAEKNSDDELQQCRVLQHENSGPDQDLIWLSRVMTGVIPRLYSDRCLSKAVVTGDARIAAVVTGVWPQP